MSRSHAWFETVMIGAVNLIALTLLVLRIAGTHDFRALRPALEYPEYVLTAGVAMSYVIGVVVIALVPVVNWVLSLMCPATVRGWLHPKGAMDARENPGHDWHVKLYSMGPPELVAAVQARYRSFMLVQSLTLAIPFLTISTLVWSTGTSSGLISFTGALIGFAAIAAELTVLAVYRRIYEAMGLFRQEVRAELDRRMTTAASPGDAMK